MSSLEKKNECEIDEEEEAGVYAFRVITSFVLPFVLHAANELGIFDIIARAGRDACISPDEIVSHFPANSPDAPNAIDRMLQLLASHSMLTCSTKILADGKVERLYGLSQASRLFVSDENGVSLAPYHALLFNPRILETWCNLEDAILKGGVPIENVTGRSFNELTKTEPGYGKRFETAMTACSTIVLKKLLQKYKGFQGLRSIVDVGGCWGTTLNMIISQYPSITGINFDLPNIVDNAPHYEGIKHIGGDMFLEVPRGDAILMKHITHNWSDDKCVKLLKNCYTALPANGKVIIMDHVLPKVPQSDNAGILACQLDSIMFTTTGGKERTEDEFKSLATRAGFSNGEVVCHALGLFIIELIK